MPSPWRWNGTSHRYHNSETGRFLSANQMAPLRDQFIEAQYSETSLLADRLAAGDITIQQWVLDFRKVLKTTYFDEYAIARGGRNAMTQANYGELGGLLKAQYKWLNNFASEIADGTQSLAQIKARSGLYIASATNAFERGKAASYGMPKLSQYPGDGKTECLRQCKCHLQIEETATVWQVHWKLGPVRTEHCGDCLGLAAEWAPLVIKKAV